MNKKSITIIFLLVIIDLTVKIFIYNYFYNCSIVFIDGVIGFEPYLHKTEDAYINYYLKLNVSDLFQIIFNFLALIFIFICNFLLKKKNLDNRLSNIGFIFCYSGIICSLMDKIFWKGSLDYILFFKWIIDIKDIYCTFSEIFIVLYLIMILRKKSFVEG